MSAIRLVRTWLANDLLSTCLANPDGWIRALIDRSWTSWSTSSRLNSPVSREALAGACARSRINERRIASFLLRLLRGSSLAPSTLVRVHPDGRGVSSGCSWLVGTGIDMGLVSLTTRFLRRFLRCALESRATWGRCACWLACVFSGRSPCSVCPLISDKALWRPLSGKFWNAPKFSCAMMVMMLSHFVSRPCRNKM